MIHCRTLPQPAKRPKVLVQQGKKYTFRPVVRSDAKHLDDGMDLAFHIGRLKIHAQMALDYPDRATRRLL